IAVTVAVLAVAIPAAGHGYTGAFTTPLRLVAAVVPLLAIPAADAVLAYGIRPWFAAAAALLAVVSVQNGLTYNLHLVKSEAFLQAATTSGWMFPLLLPDFDAPNRVGQPLTIVWIAITIALLCWPLLSERWTHVRKPVRDRPPVVLAAGVLVALAAFASIAGIFGGARFR